MTRRRLAVVALSLTASLAVLTGCSKAEDAAKGAAGDTACELAGKAVTGLRGQADAAVAELDSNPQDAQRKLSALKDAVGKAAQKTNKSASKPLESAQQALGALADQAAAAAGGAAVDNSVVVDAQEKLSKAVNAANGLC